MPAIRCRDLTNLAQQQVQQGHKDGHRIPNCDQKSGTSCVSPSKKNMVEPWNSSC